MIIRKKKCDSAGKCVTVAQPVGNAFETKGFITQLDDGQPQIRHGVAPRPIAPAPVPAPAPSPVVRILRQAPAPSPVPEVIIQQAPAPEAHPVTVVKAPVQPRITVSYVPVVKPGQVEKQVPAVKEVAEKPCGCKSSSCPCEYATAPAATCPCGDPNCGKGDMGPGGCTCGAPGCNCNKGTGEFPILHPNGAKDISCNKGAAHNTPGTGNGGHPHVRKVPSTPAELEAFWREQVPEAFRHD